MNMSVEIKCPYCGFNNHKTVSVLTAAISSLPKAMHCEVEEGGCDTLFVYKIVLPIKPVVKVYRLTEV